MPYGESASAGPSRPLRGRPANVTNSMISTLPPRTRIGADEAGDTVEEMIMKRRGRLQESRERHDSMVRELFHLQEFKLMTDYDPEVAKKDKSAVFNNFRAQYDLIDHTVGPSRRTRKTQNQHVQLLASASAPPRQTFRDDKSKSRLRISSPSKTSSVTHNGRLKSKMPPPPLSPQLATTDTESSVNGGIRFSPLSDDLLHNAPELISVAVAKAPKTSARPAQPPIDTLSTRHTPRKRSSDDTITAQPKRRKTLDAKPKGWVFELVPSKDPTPPPTPTTTTRGGRVLPRRSVASRSEEASPGPQNGLAKAPSFGHIKSLKLIVRAPPPTFTNPKQRPPPPKFNASVANYLSSFITLNDEVVSQEELESHAANEAALRERVDGLRREGRAESLEVMQQFTEPVRTSKDHWGHVIDAVVARVNAKSKRSRIQAIPAQIASKIQAYWDTQATKQDKARAQEERRLRMLAKTTMKMVVSEWKKAVFHIREQERLKEEAEELKRGQKHLDELLNQSGHLLETQQDDLRRVSRSRSGSLLADSDDEDSDDEDEAEDEEEEEEDAEDDGHEDVEGIRRENGAAETVQPFELEAQDGHPVDTERQEFFPPHTPPAESDEAGSAVVPEEQSEGDEDAEIEHLVYAVAGSPIKPIFSPVAACHQGGPPTPTSGSSTPVLRYPESISDMDVDTSESVSANEEDHSEPPEQEISMPIDEHPTLDRIPPSHPTPVSIIRHASLEVGSDGLFLDGDSRYRPPDESDGDAPFGASLPPSSPRNELHQRLDEQAAETSEHNTANLEQNMAFNEDTPYFPQSSDLEEPLDFEGSPLAKAVTAAPGENNHEELEPLDSLPPIPDYLKPFAVAAVDWDNATKITPPLLLRGVLRPYQHSGLEWLASLHSRNLNGILADEMGLGKTIQTISLLAHLACDRGIWGPHLIIVPTSVLLNWEMEFKKFLPGFKTLSYHGSTKRRKELRQGWTDQHSFNVCITSYNLASRDARIFKRKPWYYMILDEAHMIKNFKSQRWNILLMFRSWRRLLLTGTPLQNNLTELWALLQFIKSGSDFAKLKEFGDWFSNPLEKAIELGAVLDAENMERVSKLHQVLRPYLLRRLKRDVEKELPSKYEHLVLCPLSKRQRFLYDEFMQRANTQSDLKSGVYQKIANILMQLRKVCNHPDLFEVRPIVTSFAMPRSAIADYEIRELLIRRQLLKEDHDTVSLDLLGLRFIDRQGQSLITALESRRLDATHRLPHVTERLGPPPPQDTRTIEGFRMFSEWRNHADEISHWTHLAYINRLRTQATPIFSEEAVRLLQSCTSPILPIAAVDLRSTSVLTPLHRMVKSHSTRGMEMGPIIDRFIFVTPPAVALDMPHITLPGVQPVLNSQPPTFDAILHQASVKRQILFPDLSLLQYDCGKLQELTTLLRDKKSGGHRVLIFTQMTKILDVLEIFLNFHGYLYLRLDGATKIEDRQYITERFNADPRIFCFIASSRSGGVGINLTGADTVVFYDSDFNPQMDKQCEDRAHRIGQIRDVHIYRFVSRHTVEESLLRKANQKRSLDDIVIQKGEFDWRTLFNEDDTALTKALGDVEDTEDARAAALATREALELGGADEADFGADGEGAEGVPDTVHGVDSQPDAEPAQEDDGDEDEEPEEEEEGGTVAEYMLAFVKQEHDFFRDWKL